MATPRAVTNEAAAAGGGRRRSCQCFKGSTDHVDDGVTRGTDEAMLRPDEQHEALVSLELLDVLESPVPPLGVRRHPLPALHRRHGDGRERGRVLASAVHPEEAVGDVQLLVGIEADHNVVDGIAGRVVPATGGHRVT